jgi:hypothetical protein
MDKLKSYIASTPYKEYKLSTVSADASFRKYYRLSEKRSSFIVMDSSLELNSLAPFIDVTHRLLKAGVKAPKILLQNIEDGYLILEDFGDKQLLGLLEKHTFYNYYSQAIDTILKLQKSNSKELAVYDKEFLHFEMNLMKEWYLEKNLLLKLNTQEKKLIANTLDSISEVVLSQPQETFVHRDFHSRNIMVTLRGELGVIDYQDAMSGAITYDLVSLLKDCYIAFEREEIERLALTFRDKKGVKVDDKTFLKWFDFMGLQRHIKVLGIFSRLHLRDKKDAYLKDIPLVLRYTIETALRYKETKEFALFLESKHKTCINTSKV